MVIHWSAQHNLTQCIMIIKNKHWYYKTTSMFQYIPTKSDWFDKQYFCHSNDWTIWNNLVEAGYEILFPTGIPDETSDKKRPKWF